MVSVNITLILTGALKMQDQKMQDRTRSSANAEEPREHNVS